MKECPKCHTMLEDDDLFCPECGTKYVERTSEKEPDFPTTIPGLDTIVLKHLNVVFTKPGKIVTTLLHLQAYPNAAIQLLSSGPFNLVVDVALERERGEGSLIARIKESDLYPLFSADNDSDDEFFATMEMGDPDALTIGHLSRLLTEVYEQPIDVLPGYEICVNGKVLESGKSKTKQAIPEPPEEKVITQEESSNAQTNEVQHAEEEKTAEGLTEEEASATKLLLTVAKVAALAIIGLPFIIVGTSFGIGWFILIACVGLMFIAMLGTNVHTQEDKSQVKFYLILLAIIAAVMYIWGPLNADNYQYFGF